MFYSMVLYNIQYLMESQDKPFVKPLFIGVTGGTASGKTSLCRRITERIGINVSYISLDSFYKGLSHEDHANAHNYNFDHPNALDFDLAYTLLSQILKGKDIEIPQYDFTTHARIEGTSDHVSAAPIIIFEGILSLYDARIRDLMDIKIFVLTDDDVRLSRRLMRDCTERARTIEGVLYQYNRFVKKAYDEYIKPTMRYANIIVPFGSDNTTAIDFIVTNLRSKLLENPVRRQLAKDLSIPVQRSLGFEIVDYAIGYNGFGPKVTNYAAGNKMNFKLEIMIRQLINFEAPEIVDVFIEYFQKALFKLAPKDISKDSFIQSEIQRFASKSEVKKVPVLRLFYPELLSEASLNDLKTILELYQGEDTARIEVYSYFLSIWAFQELKDITAFSKTHFYTLALNDQFRKHLNLQVMEENNEAWKIEAEQQRVEIMATHGEAAYENHFTQQACFKAFFGHVNSL
ncbi:hypothetical protein FGO68_gene8479 [Halteria grandinella]|uniref:uridine/cytidine kinase n=1 Tax=Halteria grandinella TaxID=5974 RepID=A0A8J8NNT4_HALGN|nr:hypothetical protein FGO68_gene8479 [Halteria grandinella]